MDEQEGSGLGEIAPSASKSFADSTFERLVRFQVLRESFTALADRAGVELRTVSKQVRELAAFLDFPLRNIPRGRPRKPNTQKVRL